MSLLSLLLTITLASPDALPSQVREVRVYASTQRQENRDWIVLEGDVVIEWDGGSIQADRVEYNQRTGDVVADGEVVLESGPTVVAGSRMEYNVQDQLGIIHDAEGWTSEDVHFRGETVEKIAEDRYRILHGDLTSCQQPLPLWRVSWSKALIHEGETAQMWNTVVRFKRMPAAWAPYSAFPVKDERSTGFLMPQVSSSRTRGVSAKIGYFWAISRNTDAFFELSGSREETSVAPDFRYVINPQASGEFRGLWSEIRRNGSRRREIEGFYNHKQDFSNGYRWVVDLDYTSSIDFTRRNSASPDRSTIQQIVSQSFLTRSWGPYTLTFRARDRRWPDREEALRTLPEVELLQRSTKIGNSPFYYSLTTSLVRISTRTTYRVPDSGIGFQASPSYERFDLMPQIRVPLSPLPWLDVEPSLALRETIWTDQLDEDEPVVRNSLLRRESGQFNLLVSGPKLERFYHQSGEPGTRKYQQLITPSVTWMYAPDVRNTELVLPFDQVDTVLVQRDPVDPSRDIDTNLMRLGLTTSLLAKTIAGPGEQEGSSREVLSWSLGSTYFINTFRQANIYGRTERTRFNDIDSTIRWRPGDNASFTLQNIYDVFADDLTVFSLSGDVRWASDATLSFNYRKSRSTILTPLSETVNMHAAWKAYHKRLSFDTDIRYDLLNSKTQTQRYIIGYRNQCLGTRIEYFWSRYGDRQVLLTISLRNVGDFIDFHTGSI